MDNDDNKKTCLKASLRKHFINRADQLSPVNKQDKHFRFKMYEIVVCLIFEIFFYTQAILFYCRKFVPICPKACRTIKQIVISPV